MTRSTLLAAFVVANFLAPTDPTVVAEEIPVEILRGPVHEDNGVVSYVLRSPFLHGESRVQILRPDTPTNRILFLLPVTPWPGFEEKWHRLGSGMEEIVKHGYHNQFHFNVVVPDFPMHMPWFVDHAEDQTRRHETYMTHVIVPLADRILGLSDSVRDLAGFSKGGFGSLSLLFRHPTVFHAATVWDPGGIRQPYDIHKNTNLSNAAGSVAQFQSYRLESSIKRNVEHFRGKRRVALSGYSNEKFLQNLRALHRLLDGEHIPHAYSEAVQVPHRWHAGWMAHALSALQQLEG